MQASHRGEKGGGLHSKDHRGTFRTLDSPAGLLQRGDYVLVLRFLQRTDTCNLRCFWELKMEPIAFSYNHRSLDDIPQFPNIARPWVKLKFVHHSARYAANLFAHFLFELSKECRDE